MRRHHWLWHNSWLLHCHRLLLFHCRILLLLYHHCLLVLHYRRLLMLRYHHLLPLRYRSHRRNVAVTLLQKPSPKRARCHGSH